MKLAGLAAISFSRPHALYLLIGVGVLLVWWLARIDAPRKATAPLLRALILAAIVIAIAGPRRISTTTGAARAVAIDLSSSITPPMRRKIAAMLRDELKLRPSDPAIAFGRRPVSETVGEVLTQLQNPEGCKACVPEGTDLESAIRKLVDVDHGGPMVLITDGWENTGDAAAAIGAVRAAHGELYVLTPPGAGTLPNVAVSAMHLPHALAATNSFVVGVTLSNMNDHPVSGTIGLFQNKREVDHRSVKLAPGSQRFDFPVREVGTGLISYRAIFTPAQTADDQYPEDNSLQGWVGIGSRRKVLVISGSPREAGDLSEVARRLGLEPRMVSPGVAASAGPLKEYDAVILNNVPRAELAPAVRDAMTRYVRGGGALAMVGGDRSFGLGGWHGSALERMMPVLMKPPQHKERRRALVLIIDKSGSMGRNDKLTYAKAAARTAANTLRPNDLIEVIGFDSQPFVVVPLEKLSTARKYLDRMIDLLAPRGQTYLLPALKQADDSLARSGAAIKHVVILTDGETGGTPSMYYDLVSSMHNKGGVTISTIAIGRDANLQLLDAIARYGGGASYQTDSPKNLPEITLQDTRRHTAELTMVEKTFVPQTRRPDPVLKSLAGRRLPPIKGFVSTELKPDARLDAWVDAGGRREPLIASTTYGAGRTLAVTTDGGGRWAVDWIRQKVFSQLWGRLFEWMSPAPTNLPKFDVAMGFRDGRVDLHITDYGADPQRDLAVVGAQVRGPDGDKQEMMLSQSAPGELAGSFAASRPGVYHITLSSGLGGKAHPFPPLAYTVSAAGFLELPRPQPNYGLLESLTSATGGRLNPSRRELTTARPLHQTKVGFTQDLLLAAMLLLIGEALVRRLTA